MKNIIILGVCFFMISLSSFAQEKALIKGFILDTNNNQKLIDASITVIRATDSIMTKYTHSDGNGFFEIDNLPFGKMLLLVSYPGYVKYTELFNLDTLHKIIDFQRIMLTKKGDLLKEVIIKGNISAIKIKGDTTEFNAAAYKIRSNSKVEDLLKQLPGIQVDKKGQITAYGTTVTKVLLDGEEFFGDDPTLITQNIRGDMVDKVQLYDKKTDQAAFTGTDNGEKIKTINIQLKEDKKNGYFGKVDFGIATKGYYTGQGMINLFTNKSKFAAYGTVANTGKISLGADDSGKYGANGNVILSSDGNVYLEAGNSELDTYNGQYNNQGIPTVQNAGTNYGTNWNRSKESINLNYKIGSLKVTGVKNDESQNNLPSSIINTSSDQYFNNYLFRQKLDGVYQIKLDSSSNLKIRLDATIKENKVISDYITKSTENNIGQLNIGDRHLSNKGDDKLFNAQLFYTKKFKAIGRTLSVEISNSNVDSQTKGYLKAKNTFFNTSILDSSTIIDQYKTSLAKLNVLKSSVSYTEALTNRLSVIVDYALSISNSRADRQSFNRSDKQNYDFLDTLYSNNYRLRQLINQGGATFNFKFEKNLLTFGTKITSIGFDQENVFNKTVLKKRFNNWAPQIKYIYNPSQQKRFSIGYSGYNIQPTINQIQPILVNTDPLNITIGNPNLRPSFNHAFEFWYSTYKIVNGQNINLRGAYNFITNPIVTNNATDSYGKSTSQSVNLLNKRPYNIFLHAQYGRKINFIDIYSGINFDLNSNVFYNYINSAVNESTSTTYSCDLFLSKFSDVKYSGLFSIGTNFTKNQSSLQPSINDNGWGLKGNSEFTIDLPLKMGLNLEASYLYRSRTKSFNMDFHRMIINAGINKKFLKSESLKLILSVDDLLNQNVGFNRTVSRTIIAQQSYTTIKRYFMASLVWDFNKMGGKTENNRL